MKSNPQLPSLDRHKQRGPVFLPSYSCVLASHSGLPDTSQASDCEMRLGIREERSLNAGPRGGQ